MLSSGVGKVMRAELKTVIAHLVNEQITRGEAVDVYGVVQMVRHLPHVCSPRVLADEVAREVIAQHGCLLWELNDERQQLFSRAV
jgi:hypothetical protein